MTLDDPVYISNLCQFGWYELYYFRQGKAYFPEPAEELCRCLGPSKNGGNEMCQSVPQMNGRVVPFRSLHRLRPDQLAESNTSEIRKRAQFDEVITSKVVN